MPELPEVETLRRSLEPLLLGRRIAAATVHRRDVLILPADPPGGLSRRPGASRPAAPKDLLIAGRITELRRHGKQLALIADDGRALVVHLGMTGGVRILMPGENLPAHAHLVWTLEDGCLMVFYDPRRFGHIRSIPSPGALKRAWSDLGPDALAVTAAMLKTNSRRAIKAFLLDQSMLAGVGNIYADESLFRAGISPRRPARRLSTDQARSLAAAIRRILRQAIRARGSTLRDYRDAMGQSGSAQLRHRVYGRAGRPCTTCGKPLKSTIIAQRATVFCSVCQR